MFPQGKIRIPSSKVVVQIELGNHGASFAQGQQAISIQETLNISPLAVVNLVNSLAEIPSSGLV